MATRAAPGEIRLARRNDRFETYRFTAIAETIARLKAEGRDVISLISGDPDLPTPEPIVEALRNAAQDPENHHYASPEGSAEDICLGE